mgnify:CR=1 FL=1
MQEMAKKCWDIFNLKGYARVDLRVDEAGKPFVLEVNPNPCITRGIMFEKTLREGGFDYKKIIQYIIDDIRRIY